MPREIIVLDVTSDDEDFLPSQWDWWKILNIGPTEKVEILRAKTLDR
jgi:hypothetical protein